MQIHSRKCKIHLDPAVAAAGDSPAIMQVIYNTNGGKGRVVILEWVIETVFFFLFLTGCHGKDYTII